MDVLILICVLMGLFLFSIGLKSFYDYLIEKQELKKHIQDNVFVNRFSLKRRKSSSEKWLEKTFYYADDFSSLGNRVNFFSESQDVEKWLMQASYPYGLTVERFQGLKIFALLVGFVIGFMLIIIQFPMSQILIIVLPLAGYFSVILWIKNKAKKRQDDLGYVLPDFLDTVSVTLQAGIGLDQALRDIVPYFDGPVGEEFARFNQEIDLGVPREKAYRSLLDRNDNEAFQSLIKSLIQGSRLGVPVATTFKVQANEMRNMKKEKIKEEAAKASPKITLITTFIVMPTVMLLIGGLLILNMFTGEDSIMNIFK
ncbi:type II secretion system F family protein [Bacillus sp. ISL-47]|uniref:type II secretion system F family protein n=1 Tax=Bacillus sp. ISL-47 TaxID=2819130 RepID=UPI001BE5F045|nr:type II secretion system F family protein [Bacillus sp. ISL-47]MBT2691242.1 type II secretion system F family protein [Bacillus sp. ISL-47]MBT2708920.1 type II secretion system F family protein [Pseudomonas sp. ISL-84]